jgi:hypothetical protein
MTSIFALSLHQTSEPHVCTLCSATESDPYPDPEIPAPMRVFLAEEPLCLNCILKVGVGVHERGLARRLWDTLGEVVRSFDSHRRGRFLDKRERERKAEEARLEAERAARAAEAAEATRKAKRAEERDRLVGLLADPELPPPPAGILDKLFKRAPKSAPKDAP